MALSLECQATVRGSSRADNDSGLATVSMNNGGDVCVAQGLPDRAELCRLGCGYTAQMPAASAWTLLITIPTTLANLSLQNGETAGGKCYIIERFWIKAVTSMASAGSLTPLSQLVVPGTAQVADNSAVLRNSLSGKTSIGSAAKLVMASTATGCVQDRWNHHKSVDVAFTTNIAVLVEVNCFGKYIVPPQGSFNINGQESVSGGTAIAGVEWWEVQLDLG